ncbi:hypothetical protein P692DRAFT_201726700 [Suillus brevipes Sb2]|nr:hypothetical protein P692DRAFT_201726700 [Suillus brevipes Sb2]
MLKQYSEFPPRLGNEHIRRAQEYQTLDEKDRDAFFKEHSARYFELSRLSYFDPVRMSVIDPMHSFLLGIIRCHWYDSWIQTNTLRKRTEKKERELDHIHSYLETFEMPSWVGRLPEQVGYPAGGSLTSDEWKGLALVFCPIVVRSIILMLGTLTMLHYNRYRLSGMSGVPRMQPPTRKLSLHGRHEKGNGSSVWVQVGVRRKTRTPATNRNPKWILLYPDDVKPTHHWVTHIFDQLHDYGPVYNFWTFLFERLNKVLKSYSTNNHGGGEIEVSFMRAFHKDVALRDLVRFYPVMHSRVSSCPAFGSQHTVFRRRAIS